MTPRGINWTDMKLAAPGRAREPAQANFIPGGDPPGSCCLCTKIRGINAGKGTHKLFVVR